MMLNSVDLPQPDGPMMETNSPGAIDSETSSTAVIGPSRVVKRLVTRSTSSSRLGWEGALVSALTASPSVPAWLLPRRNLDQLGELLLGERRGGVLEIDRVVHDDVETDDLVRIDGWL